MVSCRVRTARWGLYRVGSRRGPGAVGVGAGRPLSVACGWLLLSSLPSPALLHAGGELVPVGDVPDQERYIISAKSLPQRQELLDRIGAAPELDPSDAQALAPLTDTMPLLVGNLSRSMLLWLCQDPQASAAIEYVEEDQQVSLA